MAFESSNMKAMGKRYEGKPYGLFDEGELEIGYGCDILTLANEKGEKL